MAKKVSSKENLIWSWFIDPWHRTAMPMEIKLDLHDWHQALQCDTLNAGYIFEKLPSGRTICVWVDDCGQLRSPPLASFMLNRVRYYGYGLINETDSAGATHDATFGGPFLVEELGLQFEDWEERLNVDNYIEQLTRIIENEKWYVRPR